MIRRQEGEKQKMSSALYQTGTNTKASSEANTWLKTKNNKQIDGNDSLIKNHAQQFKIMQLNLLNLFTEAKKVIEEVYKKTLIKIKRVENKIAFGCQNDSLFFDSIKCINDQVAQKIGFIKESISASLVDTLYFDRLGSCFQKENQETKKKSRNESLSTDRFLQHKSTHILGKSQQISSKEYSTAVIVRPQAKKVEHVSWLSGKWDCLQKICLHGKNLQQMVPAATINAPCLRQIDLSDNDIRQLSFCSQAYFPNLNFLTLKRNHITNLNGLQQAEFPLLKILNLSQNRIKNLQVLSEVGFPELVDLNLSENSLSSIDSLSTSTFPKLQILNLDHNNLKNIDSLTMCCFPVLKILSFCYNDIVSIDCLREIKFKRLEALIGYNNKIRSIDFLQKCEMPNIKEIFLNCNKIREINVVKLLNFKHLVGFDLEDNQIQDEEFLCFVAKNSKCQAAKRKFPFLQI